MDPKSPDAPTFKGWLELSRTTVTFHLQGEDHAEHRQLILQLLLQPSVGMQGGTFRLENQSPEGDIQSFAIEAVEPGRVMKGWLADCRAPFLDDISGVRLMFGVMFIPNDGSSKGLLHRLSVQIGTTWIETFGTPFAPRERKMANRALRSVRRGGALTF